MPAELAGPDSLIWRFTDRLAAVYSGIAALSGRARRPPAPVNRALPVRVSSRTSLADDVVGLEFERVDGERLPPWDPGAHVDVQLPGLRRQYSLTGDPADLRRYQIAVRGIPEQDGGRGGSLRMHELAVGDELVLKGPRHAFPFIDTQRYLFVAGGIGITPILPMVRQAAARDVEWVFVYAGRSRATMPFLSDVEKLGQAHPGRVHLWPDDERGAPTGRALIELAPPGAALYTCGPPAMIDAIRDVIPAEQVDTLHYERFSAPPVRGGRPFTWQIGQADPLPVAAGQTALAALLAVRPDAAYSCQQGFCGTCVVAVRGEVEHRDSCLTPAQRQEFFAPCVSRGRGILVSPHP